MIEIDRESGTALLSIELDIPDHVTDQQLYEIVHQLVKELDLRYRAHGGSGLVLEEVTVTESATDTEEP